MRRLTFACFVLCGVLAAGCAQSGAPADSARLEDSSVAAQQTPAPTVTFFDLNQRQRDAQNVADMLAATATIEAQNAVATQAVIVGATQQVEDFNLKTTQQAVSVAQTATAGAQALQATAQAVTATAQALEAADARATAMALQNERAQRELNRQREQDEIERQQRQTDKTAGDVRALLGLVGLGALVYAAYVGVIMAERYLDAWIDARARRALIDDANGIPVRYDPAAGGWTPLPGVVVPQLGAGTLRSPQADPPWLERLQERRGEVLDLEEARDLRDEWREAGRRWLRWTTVVAEDGEPVGLSRRRFLAATGCTRADYENARDLLVQLGLLVRRADDVYKVRAGYTAAQAVAAPVWATSFTVPERVKVPAIPDTPPAQPGPARPAQPGPAHLPTPTPPPEPPEWAETTAFAHRFNPGVDGLAVPFDADGA